MAWVTEVRESYVGGWGDMATARVALPTPLACDGKTTICAVTNSSMKGDSLCRRILDLVYNVFAYFSKIKNKSHLFEKVCVNTNFVNWQP